MPPPSPDLHFTRSVGGREGASSQAPRAPSPYRGLHLWDHEEDLIRLHTPEPEAHIEPVGARGYGAEIEKVSSSKPVPNIRAQYSLLDLDDPPSKAREHLDAEDHNYSQRILVGANPSLQRCEQCEIYGLNRSYCNVCKDLFCQPCWNLQIPHKKNRLAPGSVPHEPTDPSIAKKIHTVLELKITDDEQEILHRNDRDTAWFGIVREHGELPLFQDYGRYSTLMTNTSRRERVLNSATIVGGLGTRYPSLVSFVGQTGAGKSTIIKLVIDLSAREEDNYATPVVGSVGKDVPTSGDVHLYLDPHTADSEAPILYADCEGLEGGEREPLGAWRNTKDRSTSNQAGSIGENLGHLQHASAREITWATTNERRSRGFAVTNLYPRLLYTFSGVIVFVLKNPSLPIRVIESVFENLAKWAAAALEKSSNQPVLPHAIIVLNASENDIDPKLWDVASATSELLMSLSRTVFKSPVFKELAQFWRERNRSIESVQQLLLSYYSSIKVVRVPTRGRPNLINDQIEKLYTHIQDACVSGRRRKSELRMLLDADELQHYLHFAFDHFACNLDTPFDFVQASFVNSPIPPTFGGNILKLAINLMEVWENEVDGRTLFVELSYMVASCIMLDSARHKIRGTAEQIFPQYLEHIDAALENFCARHWPCEFVKPGGGGRCVNVRSGHGSKGHQLKNGKVLAVGGYVSQFSFERHREEFQEQIYIRLTSLLAELRSRMEDNDQPEAQAAAEIHKDSVMVHFFNHSARGQANNFISHSACFSCLIEPPEHALPCGHVLCVLCLKAYGNLKGETKVEITGCPMDKLITERPQSWNILLKPAAAGIRILTLDGGGIRGIAELETLRQIERAMGDGMPITCFFDLIVGTSTGGIIALGLGAKSWSVEVCTRIFEELCRKAFTRRFLGNIPGVGWIVDKYKALHSWFTLLEYRGGNRKFKLTRDSYNHSQYETQPLQEALITAFSEDEYLFGGPRPLESFGSEVKIAVTTTSAAGTPVILTNYNRSCTEKLPYHFQRPERLESELKIWEAARATSAAPRIFKPFCHQFSKQTYADGAIYYNNPIEIADKERKLIWPNTEDEYPDIVVSVGTTLRLTSRHPTQLTSPPRLGVLSHGKSLYKMAVERIASTLDAEKTWDNYISVLQPPPIHRPRYVRLNPQLSEEPPRLDQVHRMIPLRKLVREKWRDDPKIRQVAAQLVASSFYFEISAPVESVAGDTLRCKGHIYCRLQSESKEIRELGKFLRNSMRNGNNPYFMIREKNNNLSTQRVTLDSNVIDRMIRQCSYKMKSITLQLSNKLVITEIFLFLNEEEIFPISRFPRSLLEDMDNQEKSRKIPNFDSMRWTGRTSSQRQARTKWLAPDLNRISKKHDVLSQYSNPDYLLGGSTDQGLQRMAWRLKFGGPDPKITLPELPGDLASAHELADTGPAAERALSRNILSSKEPVRELEDVPPIAELEGDSAHTFQFFPSLRPKRPIPDTDLTPTELTSEISSKISEDLPNTEAPSDSTESCSIHDLNDDLFDLYYY